VISVLIPVRDGGADLVRCLEAVARQRGDAEVEVVVVDSGSSDGSAARARRLGVRVHEISPEEFDHGATRNLAGELARGEVLVFTTQDAYAERDDWLQTLVAPLDDPDVAGVYGRQVAHEDARPPERFFLDFLYGPEPRSQRASGLDELSLETTLFSNVNSAMRREVWERNRFAEGIVMSEDQEWSRRMLLAGRSIVYEPRAVVRHSHAYTLGSAFCRFFASGMSAEDSYLSGSSSRGALRRAALSYAGREIAWLWRTGQRRWLPYTAVYELTKLAALQLGSRHRKLPPRLTRRLRGA
jgi:rhamnosyltransferase